MLTLNSETTKSFRVSVGLRQGCSVSPILFLIYMDRIVKKSEFCGGVKIGDCAVLRPLFADDLVLFNSTPNDLQQALDRFSYTCSVAGMKIRTTKIVTICLKDGIGPCWFIPNPTRTRRSKPEPDPNPRPHKEARFGPTVVFPVH